MAVYTEGAKRMILDLPEHDLKFDIRKDYDTDPIVVKEMFEENVYEIHGWHFSDDGVTVDLGSNIGAFAIQAVSIGAKKVYAVEPEPHNLKALKNNISLNNLDDVISVLEVGVSDFNGSATITDEGGGATIKDGKPGAEIKIITLDKLFKDNKIDTVDVLKIDVEGSEVEIILAASKETIDKCNYITIEFDTRSGARLGDMVMKLSETHHVRTMGSWERGGMIFANRY
jgi:FkbM family methyltransferase